MSHTSTGFEPDFYDSALASFTSSSDQHGDSGARYTASDSSIPSTSTTLNSENIPPSSVSSSADKSRNGYRTRGFGRGSRARRNESFHRTSEKDTTQNRGGGRGRWRGRGRRGQRGGGQGQRGTMEKEEMEGEEEYRPRATFYGSQGAGRNGNKFVNSTEKNEQEDKSETQDKNSLEKKKRKEVEEKRKKVLIALIYQF